MTFRTLFFFSLLLTIGLRLPAQTPTILLDHPLTLEEVIGFAVANNPTILRAKLDEQSNEYRIKEVKASALPQLSANGQWNNSYLLAEQLLPAEVFGGEPGTTVPVRFGVANTIIGTVELRQTLFDKSIFTGLKAAKSAQELFRLQTFKSTEDLVYDMIGIYLQLQVTKEQVAVLEGNLERIGQLVEISQIQFEEGIIKRIDVDQLKVNKTNIETQILTQEIGMTRLLNNLKFFMGLGPGTDIELAPYELDEEPYPLQDRLMLERNTDLRLLDKQVELNAFDAENIRAGFWPNLSAFINYGWQGQTDKLFSSEEELNGNPTGTFGLALSVPIFDGFRRRNQVAQVRVQREQLALDRLNLANNLRTQFDNASQTLRQNRRLVQAQQQNMQLARGLFDVTKLSYQEGVAPLTELLNAETSLNQAQSQYLNALLELKIAEVDHLQTSGELATLISQNQN